MSFSIVLGDLKPMTGQLTANGSAFPLTVDDTVTLSYETPGGVTMSKVLDVTSTAEGQWSAEWEAGDLPEVGFYRGQIQVERLADTTFPRSFPDDGSYIWWTVYPKIPVTP